VGAPEAGGAAFGGDDHGRYGGRPAQLYPTRPEADILAEYARGINFLCEPSRFLRRAYATSWPCGLPARLWGSKRKRIAGLGGKSPLQKKDRFGGTCRNPQFFWRQGVRADFRGQFWRQLVEVYRRNPSRLRKYLLLCVMGRTCFGGGPNWPEAGGSRSGCQPVVSANPSGLITPDKLKKTKASRPFLSVLFWYEAQKTGGKVCFNVGPIRPFHDYRSLARFDNYLLTRKNSRYDLNSEIDLLWGDFQNPFCPTILCLDGELVWSNLDHYP